MFVHQCAEGETTAIELLATVQATLRSNAINTKTFWFRDLSDINEDGEGVMVSSIYCTTCEKFVVSFDDSLSGRELITVETELDNGAYAEDGIVWEED